MKTEAIQPQIIKNYNTLSKLANIPSQNNKKFFWAINYNDNEISGFANQLGIVETNRSQIQINGDKLLLKKKSFYSTSGNTLKNINTLLEKMIKYFNNKNFVTKNFLQINCFSENAVNKIAGRSGNA